MNATLQLVFILSLTSAALAQTGGSTVIGAGAGTSAPPAQDVRIAPTVPPPVPQERGGLNANVPPTTATLGGRVVNVLPQPVTAVQNANTGVSLISGNANTTLTNASGGAVVGGLNANGAFVANANGAVVVPPAAPVLRNATPVRAPNTGPGNGPGLPAGGIAPSGPRIEPAMTTSGSAGVVPSGPRVETLPQTGAPTTVAPSR